MRITNKMMSTNCMTDINKNKIAMNKLQEQYSTGKKISTPSEDPIIAVRALKLRSTYAELNQFVDKNIPSAQSWLDTTEGALTNINTLLTSVYEQCTQGANDTLSVTDRNAIISNLQEYVKQIYQEGNTEYAGRYVFTGYKTGTSLTFPESTTNLNYDITENFSGSDIVSSKYVVNGYSFGSYDGNDADATDYATTPETVEVYRLRLAYDNLTFDETTNEITYTVDGTEYKASVVSSSDPDAYLVSDDVDAKAHFIPETGELIFNKSQYESFSKATTISVDYSKDSFDEYDLRPEHYFDCTATEIDSDGNAVGKPIEYQVSNQEIKYEINFGQSLTVNTQAKDCLTQTLAREVEELTAIVNQMASLETDIAAVKSKLAESSTTDEQKEALTKLQEQLETQYTLQSKIMSDRFSEAMTTTKDVQSSINSAVSSLGARYSRLELTESRLIDQRTELEDLISTNEDADLVQTVVKYNSQQTIYNASLSVASKVVKNTLLDYI